MRRSTLIVAAFAGTAVTAPWTRASIGLGQDGERSIVASAGRSIPAQIRPTDKRVTVLLWDGGPGLAEPPANTSWFAWLAALSDAAVIADVVDQTAHFTEDQSSITSTVRVSIVDVVKQDPAYALRVGNGLEFEVPGGTLVVRGTEVVGTIPWREDFAEGGRYLLFVRIRTGGTPLIGARSAFEVRDTRVFPLIKGPRGPRLPSGVPTAQVVAEIERSHTSTMPAPDRGVQREDVASSDARLTTRVKTALLKDPEVRAWGIEVQSAAGVVTLTGSVGSAAERDRAVTVALGVRGVLRVQSELVVK